MHGRIETAQPLTNQLTSAASGVKAEKQIKITGFKRK